MKDEAGVMIIIPTTSLERFQLLVDTIDSIRTGSYKNTHVAIVSDGNSKLFEAIRTRNEWLELRNITVIANKERKDWVFSVNRVLKEFDSEYYIYASDDLIFPPDCIEYAMVAMGKCFPDGFGDVDLGRKNRGTFGLFGRKLVNHFPGRQVFCPDYVHYCSDGEFYRAVKKMGKYAYPPERGSQVEHFRLNDETRRFARRVRAEDRKIWHEREEKGYLWGIDFNLVAGKR